MKYKGMSEMVVRYGCPFPSNPYNSQVPNPIEKNKEEQITEKNIDDHLCNLVMKLDWEFVLVNQYSRLFKTRTNNTILELKITEPHSNSYITSLVIKYNKNKKDPGLNEIEIDFPGTVSYKIAKHILACQLKKDKEKEFQNKKEAYETLSKIVNE